MSKPDCYACKHRRPLLGDCHSACAAPAPVDIAAATHGVKNGWFMWPYNFDPTWLEECSAFQPIKEVVSNGDPKVSRPAFEDCVTTC